tara:strand:- start:191 stop:571 length:381 start_codon:yes stop_codon:yes gene_type:complete
MPKYIYATCEPYNEYKHGFDQNTSINIREYHMVIDTHTCYRSFILGCYYLNRQRIQHTRYFGNNFKPKIHLIEPIFLEGGEMVCILKTFWISIFQKIWRKKYRKRQIEIAKYKKLKNLFNREIMSY